MSTHPTGWEELHLPILLLDEWRRRGVEVVLLNRPLAKARKMTSCSRCKSSSLNMSEPKSWSGVVEARSTQHKTVNVMSGAPSTSGTVGQLVPCSCLLPTYSRVSRTVTAIRKPSGGRHTPGRPIWMAICPIWLQSPGLGAIALLEANALEEHRELRLVSRSLKPGY